MIRNLRSKRKEATPSSKTKNKAKKKSKKAPKKASKKKTSKKKVTSKKKSKSEDPVDQWIEDVAKSKKYKGKAQVRMANEVASPYYLRRPFGVLGLDLALGGGMHAGGALEVHGKQSVGKTFLAFHAAGELQRIYGEDARIIIYSTEIKPDKGFARHAGLCIAYSDYEIQQMNQLRIDSGLNPFTAEERSDLRKQIGKIVVIVSDTAETGFNLLIDALKLGHFQLVIVESLGALLTKAQDEKDVGERTVAGPSVAVTHWQNKSFPLFMMDRPDGSLLETTVLGINQERANVARTGRQKDSQAAMGAYSWKHAQLASICLELSSAIREGEKGPTIGRTIRWRTEKGKAGTRDGLLGTYDYFHIPRSQPVFWKDVSQVWYGGISVFNEMVETAIEQKVIKVAGSWLTWPYKKGKVLKAQGIERMAQKLADDEDLEEMLKGDCFRKAGILVRNR